ncbi:NAD(P)H-dependent oxidoreductase [Henriciella sp.]|uniref:NAD(P)H-dependent oxidoreductase n=1 Tax=Henriciella sp. TaxID=1968823 RepID=UPI0026351DD1|nr:NAD(P)H-dependent oxidoreductase [Henriciella sp.]
MSIRIFIWVGHPSAQSLSHGMADAYQVAAEAEGAEIRRMHLNDMSFDPDLTYGFKQRKPLEPCLETWRENIVWSNHLCWAYPYWWGSMPAKMKGVIDRAYLPGFAMRYHEKGPWWDKLLTGRSADMLITADSPAWYDRLVYGRPGRNQAENLVLKYAGIKPVRALHVGAVKQARPEKIKHWLKQAGERGRVAGRRVIGA